MNKTVLATSIGAILLQVLPSTLCKEANIFLLLFPPSTTHISKCCFQINRTCPCPYQEALFSPLQHSCFSKGSHTQLCIERKFLDGNLIYNKLILFRQENFALFFLEG